MDKQQNDGRARRLSGTHITIIVVAALCLVVPGTAFAVTAANTVLVDPKTGQPAYVTNHQLNVRGIVGTSDVVPTQSITVFRRDEQIGKPINDSIFLAGDGQGRAIEIGSINIVGYTNGSGPDVEIYTHNVTLPSVCTTTAPGPTIPSLVFEAVAPTGASPVDLGPYTFPLPLVVQPHTNQRTCIYAYVSGVSDVATISMTGAYAVSQ